MTDAEPGRKRPGLTFAELIAPLDPDAFLAEILGQRWLLLPGSADKAEAVFGWEDFNALLEMDVWSGLSLNLVLDGKKAPPASFCRSVVDRNRMQVMRPDPAKVRSFLQQGSSVVLNEMGGVSPSVGATVDNVLKALNGHGNANLYYSQKARRAFDSHCDRHEVFALQISGEKTWRIYKGRANAPIEHPQFRNIPPAEIDRAKGPVDQEIVMTPGDVLYLPRGQYHDALATSDDSLHVSISILTPMGLNLMQDLVMRLVEDPAFRQDLPRPDGPVGQAALREHVDELVKRFGDVFSGDRGLRIANDVIRGFTGEVSGGSYDIPKHRDVGAAPEAERQPLRARTRR